ncbi:glycosyltransferase family 2 protein [Roseomonas sp. CCTCC AB2023176]|uniref:glycosyltransferase family 2 protein n=1 Tax=Roseomonas sp. CCTCC AB2023176 TaxID=3342640 RepID=UPI0035D96974
MSDAAAPAEAPSARRGEDGYIDFYGYAPAVGSWLFCGWSRGRWRPDAPPPRIVAHFAAGRVEGEDAVATWYPRPDLGRRGAGLVVLLRAAGQPLGELVALDLLSADGAGDDARPVLRVPPVRPVVHLRESDLVPRVRATLMHAPSEPGQARLLTLLSRRAYVGTDTLHELPAPVQIGVDEVLPVPPDGLALIGWCLDPTDAIAAIRVRGAAGARSPDSLRDRWIPVERPDVVTSVGAAHGLSDPRVGFVAYAGACGAAPTGGENAYLEVELRGGEIGYKRLPPPARTGAAAARRLLEAVRLTPDEIEPAFDRVLGPALTAIHGARLTRPRHAAEIRFGAGPEAPVCSVIVPLYGRMDFLAYQLALLSEHPGHAAHEFIYVLDDPPRKGELLDIAHAAHRRFGLPFRVVAPAENLGFGPANNLGLSRARGEFVCLLNSDVMPAPDAPRWLETLMDGLRADPCLGVAGALLLFEDGTVQHEGITFERLPQQANWPFPMHPRKGLLPRPDPALGPEPVDAVTGACMVMRRALAEELGGFDEAYAIGDFEDSDLCLRIRARGLTCAMDRRARLYHLERQSQVTPDNLWRHHGTLLNAWTHTRRWFPDTAPGGD